MPSDALSERYRIAMEIAQKKARAPALAFFCPSKYWSRKWCPWGAAVFPRGPDVTRGSRIRILPGGRFASNF